MRTAEETLIRKHLYMLRRRLRFLRRRIEELQLSGEHPDADEAAAIAWALAQIAPKTDTEQRSDFATDSTNTERTHTTMSMRNRDKLFSEQAMHDRSQEAQHWQGVDALAFHLYWGDGEHVAIGVYRLNGRLIVRRVASSFSSRVPNTARKLYLQTIYSVNDARWVHENVTGLPVKMAELIEQAAAQEEERHDAK